MLAFIKIFLELAELELERRAECFHRGHFLLDLEQRLLIRFVLKFDQVCCNQGCCFVYRVEPANGVNRAGLRVDKNGLGLTH